ncbi:MAG: FIST C-terminal domain-containing protein [Actinobacteria bacterium]|nr:FIST C-terminal domain-containing protein [Actinomycetota bacterium]
MIAETFTWRAADGWSPAAPAPDGRASLVLLMGDRGVIDTATELGLDPLGELAAVWDGHGLLGWSTDGQAIGGVVHDDALVATVVRFDSTRVHSATAALRTAGSARRAGRDVAETLAEAEADLRVVMVAADGVLLNGSAIAAGITDVLPDVQVIGVLAADGSRYERAWTLVSGAAESGHVCAVGLYGDRLEIAHGAGTGWTPVGPERLVTNTIGNVIHELDGQTATELYRDYLGPLADDLVANSSMLPMEVRDLDDHVTVRSPRRFHADGSVAMSGDVPQGATVRLLRASPADLAHDAALAAKAAHLDDAGLCLVVSAAGRRRVLGQRVEDELDAVIDAMSPATPVVACWAYGALAPTELGLDVVDETICITTVRERPVSSPDLPHDADAPDPQQHQQHQQNQQNQEG